MFQSIVNRFIKVMVGVVPFLVPMHLAEAGSWQNGQALGGFNTVNVYTPDSNSPIGPAGKKSLMIVLHGCVQPISNYSTANLEDAAEAYGMVIAVPDAAHKEGFSCWAYWSNSQSGTPARNKRDYENLIQLAEEMRDDAGRNIDADQIYIAGLSSGAAFAAQTGCLAPDIFSGVASSAGPTIGTTDNGALGPCESVSAATYKSRCNSYAGSNASHFATQITSIAHGDADGTVNLCYNTQNSNGIANVYGVSQLSGTNTISEGSKTATETLWEDGRVSMLWLNGADHAWSGGAGASGSYITSASINYASYLGNYFATYNNRVDRNAAPEVSNLSLSVNGSVISVSATITDAEGSVSSATATLTNASTGASAGSVSLSGSGSSFTGDSASLADALYNVSVTATDNEGAVSEAVADTVRVGPEPPAQAPTLSNISVDVAGQCATVSGTVVDENQNLSSVVVAFNSGNVTATLNGTSYSAEGCNLPGGSNTATVTATDTGGLSSNDSINFDIDAGQDATLDNHIAAGRLDYTNYSNCYLEYGSDVFTLHEITVNASTNTCQWQDDDASCIGPDVTCSTSGGGSGDGGSGDGGSGDGGSGDGGSGDGGSGDGGSGDGGSGDGGSGDGGSTCQEETAFNYYHKTGGRAYSTGSFWSPNYFANGSDDPMPGSTWGNTTLHSTDGGTVWNVGSCP